MVEGIQMGYSIIFITKESGIESDPSFVYKWDHPFVWQVRGKSYCINCMEI